MRLLVFVTLYSIPLLASAADSGGEAGPWWLGHLVSFLGTVIAAGMIVYQLGRQHTNETNRQNENFKSQLRLQIYQEFSECLASASEVIGQASNYSRTCHAHAAIYRDHVAIGINPAPISDRPLDLLSKKTAAIDQAIEVIFLIEKYFIVHPNLEIFRTATSCAIYDIEQAFQPLFDFMLHNFPADTQTPNGPVVIRVKVLTDQELGLLNAIGDALANAFTDLDCYFQDLRTELQTLLLGHLFGNDVAKRRPADPSKRVISLDPTIVKSLNQHFYKCTAWGRHSTDVQLQVHKHFHG